MAPRSSREAVEQELATLDFLETQIEAAEQRLEVIMKVSAEADLLKTLPCVGKILSMVLMLGKPCRAAVSTDQKGEESSESGGGGWAPPGRGGLVDTHETRLAA